MPYTPPPATVSYRVRINLNDWNEYLSAPRASKFVADNIKYGHHAEVVFVNAQSIQIVRSNFNDKIDEWLRQLDHTDGFHWEPTDLGAHYRLTK